MPRRGNYPQSLSDAELAEDAIEDVVCADGADYFAQGVESMPDFCSEKLIAVGGDKRGGCRQRFRRSPQATVAASGSGGDCSRASEAVV